MKKHIYTIVIVLFTTSAFTQSWNWANRAGNNGPDYITNICNDNSGFCYAGMTSWGSPGGLVTFNNDEFYLNGDRDFFIIKYNTSGDEIWIKQFGGPYAIGSSHPEDCRDAIYNLLYCQTTNTIIAFGNFASYCNFGTITLNAWEYDDQDIYVAKFDLNGNCIWAKKAGGSGRDRPGSIALDDTGNVYLVAHFPYNGGFGNIQVPFGAYLAKYDPEGNVVWSKQIFSNGLPGSGFPLKIEGSKVINGALYLTGWNSASTFTIDTITYSYPDYEGHLVVKFDLVGNIQWLRCLGGPSATGVLYDPTNDDEGNLYFTSYFQGEYATFGTDTIYSNGDKEMYVAKYNPYGEPVWINQSNATQSAKGIGCHIGHDDFLYLTGGFKGIMDFGSFQLSSISDQDIFLLKLNLQGEFIAGDNTNGGIGCSIIQNADGTLNILGRFFYTATFGDIVLLDQFDGWGDMFIAQHTPLTVGYTEEIKKDNQNNLLIYANPNEGRCTISIPEELQNEKTLYLLVYDNTGKLIHRETIDMQAERISINLEAFAKGIYNAILTNGKIRYEGKIVFE